MVIFLDELCTSHMVLIENEQQAAASYLHQLANHI